MVTILTTTPRRRFTDAYLLSYSAEHVFYEVDHFFWLAQMLGDKPLALGAPSAKDIQRLNNILIEGFVIHLRNLIDFLYLSKPHPTDVVAADFFRLGDWEKIRPSAGTLDVVRTRANKEIAHLTTDRMSGRPPEKQWNFKALAAEVTPILQLMCSKGLTIRLAPNVASAIR